VRQESLQLKVRIEQWIQHMADPVLYRQGRRLGRLKELHLNLDCVARNVFLSCHIQGSKLRARVLRAVEDDFGTIALHTQRQGRTEFFEIRPELQTLLPRPLLETRRDFQGLVEKLIGRHFPNAKILKSSVASDLEHSLSGKYVRVQFQSGGSRWLAIAAGPQECQSTIDGVLSNGLLWRALLKQQGLAGSDKMMLLAPSHKLQVLKSRLGWIRGAGRDLQLVAMDCETETLTPVDLRDCGNLDTALTQVRTLSDSSHDAEFIRRIVSLAPEYISCDRTGNNYVVFRIRGLELARLQLGRRSRLTFGLGAMRLARSESDWARLKSLVAEVVMQQGSYSGAGNPRGGPRPERWLESLLLQDVRVIDARLNPRFIYPQVPAFLGSDRGMIDILSVTSEGRLAILELKVSEDIELPMQSLDYWLRVRWHHSRNEFQTRGYFAGVTLSPLPPLLFLVCPQFRYHSSFPLLIGQIDSSVPFVQVGINEDWRQGVRVVLRRTLA